MTSLHSPHTNAFDREPYRPYLSGILTQRTPAEPLERRTSSPSRITLCHTHKIVGAAIHIIRAKDIEGDSRFGIEIQASLVELFREYEIEGVARAPLLRRVNQLLELHPWPAVSLTWAAAPGLILLAQ